MTGAVALAAVPMLPAHAAIDPEAAEVARLFEQLPENLKVSIHYIMRAMLDLPDDPALRVRYESREDESLRSLGRAIIR